MTIFFEKLISFNIVLIRYKRVAIILLQLRILASSCGKIVEIKLLMIFTCGQDSKMFFTSLIMSAYSVTLWSLPAKRPTK